MSDAENKADVQPLPDTTAAEERRERARQRSRRNYQRTAEKRRSARRSRYAPKEECPVCMIPVAVGNATHVNSMRHRLLAARQEREAAAAAAKAAEDAAAAAAAAQPEPERIRCCTTSCRLCRRLGDVDREKEYDDGSYLCYSSNDEELSDVDEETLLARGWKHELWPGTDDDLDPDFKIYVSDDEVGAEADEV